jgi:putative membrane protein
MPNFTPRLDRSLEDLLKGAAAGAIATVPMSIFMVLGWMLLPRRERYALPPYEVTGEVLEKAGLDDHMDEPQLTTATLLAHFGFGAATGALYGRLEDNLPLQPALKGAVAGLAVWVGSYLGWIPALDILKPATRHPLRRNALMIFVHLVWGAALGLVFEKFNKNWK